MYLRTNTCILLILISFNFLQVLDGVSLAICGALAAYLLNFVWLAYFIFLFFFNFLLPFNTFRGKQPVKYVKLVDIV